MNSFIKILKESRTILFIRLLPEAIYEAFISAKHLSGSGMSKNPDKLMTPIAVTTHALEKGMSIGNVRAGFGKEKAYEVLKRLELYIKVGGSLKNVEETCSVLRKYIDYNKNCGADMKRIECFFEAFCDKYKVNIVEKGGVYIKSLQETKKLSGQSFETFSQSRYSVRDFSKTPINKEAIRKALKLCERTPSACNRQRWHIYVYESQELKDKILSMQGGAKGFYEDMQAAILVCGDMRGYGLHELHQIYVDGGLYAMNLLYCLHYEGLATIPLTMGHKLRKTLFIKEQMNIPEYEIPVVLVGIGSYKDEYRVAVSERKPFNCYCSFK